MQGKSNDFMSVHFQATPNFKLYFNIRYFGAHILSDLGIAMETKINFKLKCVKQILSSNIIYFHESL